MVRLINYFHALNHRFGTTCANLEKRSFLFNCLNFPRAAIRHLATLHGYSVPLTPGITSFFPLPGALPCFSQPLCILVYISLRRSFYPLAFSLYISVSFTHPFFSFCTLCFSVSLSSVIRFTLGFPFSNSPFLSLRASTTFIPSFLPSIKPSNYLERENHRPRLRLISS